MTYDLLSWGANSHHQLGQGIESEQCLIPTAVDLNDLKNEGFKLSEIKKLTGGAGHSLMLTMNGEVYSCGLNTKGQAGKTEAVKKFLKFEIIDELKGEIIVDVACGWDSSMAINEKGDLYVWGSNTFGQLGVNSNKMNNNNISSKVCCCLYKPTKVTHFLNGNNRLDPVVNIAMGLRHSVIVTKSGKVLVSGYGNKCQLGIIDSSNKTVVKKINTFTQVPELNDIKNASCGQHHTIVSSKNGDLWVWGDNKHGQLGIDFQKYPRIETPIKLSNVNVGSEGKIFTGWTHTAVLLNDGKVFAWGRNSYGQIGREYGLSSIDECDKFSTPQLVKNVTKLTQLSLGSEHNIGLEEEGTITCWGWNEHGNCGTGNVEDVRIPTLVKIPKNSRGILVGTGSGHSFAIVEYNDR